MMVYVKEILRMYNFGKIHISSDGTVDNKSEEPNQKPAGGFLIAHFNR
jgi:hypothetical protein